MTPWEKMRDRVEAASESERRRWMVLVPLLIAIALLVALGPWALWVLSTAAIWLLAIGAVVFVAIRLALRER